MKLSEKFYSEAVGGINPEWMYVASHDWFNYVASLPSLIQYSYLIEILDAQVQNGGFHQYFANRYGQFFDLTIAGLVAINDKERADLLISATKFLKNNNEDDGSFRSRIITGEINKKLKEDESYEVLGELDKVYYSMPIEVMLLLEQYLISTTAS